MFKPATVSTLVALAMAALSGTASAGNVLIVNGASGTSEPGTTASITANLQTLHEAVGNTVTVVSDIPAALTGYSQVWDIRFSNNFALTTAQQSEYLAFLQAGHGMFLMGENSYFMPRNNSIFDFVTLAGGGNIGGSGLVGACDGVQNVLAPFTGPNPVTSIDFQCSGVVGSRGSGDWITQRAGQEQGSGIAWGVGDLSNAMDAALTVIFDVNFMQQGNTEPRVNLTKNLIGFIGDQVDPPNGVPVPGSLALLGLGLVGLATTRKRF